MEVNKFLPHENYSTIVLRLQATSTSLNGNAATHAPSACDTKATANRA